MRKVVFFILFFVFWVPLVPLLASLCPPWRRLDASGLLLGPSWPLLGACWASLGPLLVPLGRFLVALRRLLDAPGRLFGLFWKLPAPKIELKNGKNQKTLTWSLFFHFRMYLSSNPSNFQLPTQHTKFGLVICYGPFRLLRPGKILPCLPKSSAFV